MRSGSGAALRSPRTTSPMTPHRAGGDTNAFFAATLVLWAVLVGFEIGAQGRRELAPMAAVFAFFQAANAAVRIAVFRGPLFVNTAVSLLQYSLTSASGLVEHKQQLIAQSCTPVATGEPYLILLICFTLALYRKVTINYLILSLVCELHSIFLHVRKVRRMAGFRDFNRKMVKLEWALNWTTLVTARVE